MFSQELNGSGCLPDSAIHATPISRPHPHFLLALLTFHRAGLCHRHLVGTYFPETISNNWLGPRGSFRHILAKHISGSTDLLRERPGILQENPLPFSRGCGFLSSVHKRRTLYLILDCVPTKITQVLFLDLTPRSRISRGTPEAGSCLCVC